MFICYYKRERIEFIKQINTLANEELYARTPKAQQKQIRK